MNNIKVTVSYDKPTTTKFDALMAEYEVAKKMADETVSYYKPLADAAEDAKFDAIMEQLETIADYAKRICEIDINHKAVWIKAYVFSTTFSVCYRKDYHLEIKWDGANFTKENLHQHPHWFCNGDYNIMGNWDKWEVYQKLEDNACYQLKSAITKQTIRCQKQIDRLNNIQK
jgi:hypothetical protein